MSSTIYAMNTAIDAPNLRIRPASVCRAGLLNRNDTSDVLRNLLRSPVCCSQSSFYCNIDDQIALLSLSGVYELS